MTLFVRLVAAALIAAALTGTGRAETLTVIGAGSLNKVVPDLIRHFPNGEDAVATPEFGPSGLMREKIEAGAAADIFASADMDHARRLAAGYPQRVVINFTRNSMCAVARPSLGLVTAKVLDTLLDPQVRVATSTPGADPGGDYAFAVFDRAEAVRPGAAAALKAKALKLVGGGDKTPPLVPGKGAVEGVFLTNSADMMLVYCSNARLILPELPDLSIVPLPPELTVGAAYGMVVLSDKPVATRFAAFVMSETGQSILRKHGFQPVAAADDAPAITGVLIGRAGQPTTALPASRLGSLPHVEQRVVMRSQKGEETATWSGPLLWDVLVAAGKIDPSKPGDHARLTARVFGADGYVASVGVAEFSPEFGNRQIQLVDRADGVPLAEGGWRLVVPGDARAGRWVRNVVRVDLQ